MIKSNSLLRGAALALTLAASGFVTVAHAAPGDNNAFGAQQEAVVRQAAATPHVAPLSAMDQAVLASRYQLGENVDFRGAIAPQASSVTAKALSPMERATLDSQFRPGQNTAFVG